jgi:hypothetical protein
MVTCKITLRTSAMAAQIRAKSGGHLDKFLLRKVLLLGRHHNQRQGLLRPFCLLCSPPPLFPRSPTAMEQRLAFQFLCKHFLAECMGPHCHLCQHPLRNHAARSLRQQLCALHPLPQRLLPALAIPKFGRSLFLAPCCAMECHSRYSFQYSAMLLP